MRTSIDEVARAWDMLYSDATPVSCRASVHNILLDDAMLEHGCGSEVRAGGYLDSVTRHGIMRTVCLPIDINVSSHLP